MNAIKNAASKGKNTLYKLRDPLRWNQIRHEAMRNLVSYTLVKRLFILTGFFYMYHLIRNWKINFYGTVSRMTGNFANTNMPKWFISPMLRMYCKFYSVNVDEIHGQTISPFSSFNQFFTRKLVDG